MESECKLEYAQYFTISRHVNTAMVAGAQDPSLAARHRLAIAQDSGQCVQSRVATGLQELVSVA
jgi:hypothetical protein